jgi:hypothetical protein
MTTQELRKRIANKTVKGKVEYLLSEIIAEQQRVRKLRAGADDALNYLRQCCPEDRAHWITLEQAFAITTDPDDKP